jgi:hypothetical protein
MKISSWFLKKIKKLPDIGFFGYSFSVQIAIYAKAFYFSIYILEFSHFYIVEINGVCLCEAFIYLST